MQKVFITASFQESENKSDIEKLCSLVRKSGFEDFCFIRDIEHYTKIYDNPQKLMQKAKEEIEKCDLLLIDMTDKPTGRAIEAGIAYALGKKIIVITKKGTQIKDTTKGISSLLIEYNNLDDILAPLTEFSRS